MLESTYSNISLGLELIRKFVWCSWESVGRAPVDPQAAKLGSSTTVIPGKQISRLYLLFPVSKMLTAVIVLGVAVGEVRQRLFNRIFVI